LVGLPLLNDGECAKAITGKRKESLKVSAVALKRNSRALRLAITEHPLLTTAQRSRNYRQRKAEQRIASDRRHCVVCDEPLKGQRADAQFCSTKCRMRFNRRNRSLRYLAFDPAMERFKHKAKRSLKGVGR
jgi:predicted nucleic acid-binding Zn ribbon protein